MLQINLFLIVRSGELNGLSTPQDSFPCFLSNNQYSFRKKIHSAHFSNFAFAILSFFCLSLSLFSASQLSIYFELVLR